MSNNLNKEIAATATWKTGPGSGTASRNPEQTRSNILSAATTEFAAHGLEGGRTDRIAKQAGVSKRMLFHYFGSKEGLFQAVLESNYAEIRSAESKLQLSSLIPEEAMAELVEFSFNWFLTHPEFVPLLNEANLHKGRHVRASSKVQKLTTPLVERIGDVLKRGADAGTMRPEVDPVELYMSIAGASYFYFSNRHTLSVIFDRDLMNDAALSRRRQHIVELILGYLHAPTEIVTAQDNEN
ncbi:MAG: TetR/AcrR family transcriptional regulator [Hyphomicrobiales bacterium]|nr:TetR/AcrR family transcriptional regulator [Hyphomicrobiales bacterium]